METIFYHLLISKASVKIVFLLKSIYSSYGAIYIYISFLRDFLLLLNEPHLKGGVLEENKEIS